MLFPTWLQKVISTVLVVVQFSLLGLFVSACGSSNSVALAPPTQVAPESNPGATTLLTSENGVFRLPVATPGTVAGQIRVNVTSPEPLPASLTIQGVRFVKLPLTIVVGMVSYAAEVGSAFTSLADIQEVMIEGVRQAGIRVERLARGNQRHGRIFQGNLDEVTFVDFVLVYALTQLPVNQRTAENIATTANTVYPAGNVTAASLVPVPTEANTNFVVGPEPPAVGPDFRDAVVVYAATQLPANVRTAENLAAVANQVYAEGNIQPSQVIGIPGSTQDAILSFTRIVTVELDSNRFQIIADNSDNCQMKTTVTKSINNQFFIDEIETISPDESICIFPSQTIRLGRIIPNTDNIESEIVNNVTRESVTIKTNLANRSSSIEYFDKSQNLVKIDVSSIQNDGSATSTVTNSGGMSENIQIPPNPANTSEPAGLPFASACKGLNSAKEALDIVATVYAVATLGAAIAGLPVLAGSLALAGTAIGVANFVLLPLVGGNLDLVTFFPLRVVFPSGFKGYDRATGKSFEVGFEYVESVLPDESGLGGISFGIPIRGLCEEEEDNCKANPDQCTNAPTFGDPHIFTFDGLPNSFQAVGEFIHSKDTMGSFEVQTRFRGINSNVSLTDAVAMRIGSDRVGLYSRASQPLLVNGIPTEVTSNPLRLPGGGRIFREFDTFQFLWPSGELLTADILPWVGTHLSVTAAVPLERQGQYRGLLGNANGNPNDDMQTQQGQILPTDPSFEERYSIFGNSWRITQDESLFDYAPGETTATFTDLNFPSQQITSDSFPDDVREAAAEICRAAGITNPAFLEACIIDVAETGENGFAESAANIQNEFIEGWVINPNNLHRYLAYSCGNWNQCEAKARDLGSHLVSIGNQDEQSWLIDTFGSSAYWIGLTDEQNEGEFIWTSGEQVTYTNWSSGEPSNSWDGEDYVAMNWGAEGEWNDLGQSSPEWGLVSTAIFEQFSEINLSGTWEGDGYACQDITPPQLVSVVQEEDGRVVATKLTGDDCVPEGNITFQGNARPPLTVGSSFPVTFTTGLPSEPACCSAPDTVSILDNNTFTSFGVTFSRLE